MSKKEMPAHRLIGMWRIRIREKGQPIILVNIPA